MSENKAKQGFRGSIENVGKRPGDSVPLPLRGDEDPVTLLSTLFFRAFFAVRGSNDFQPQVSASGIVMNNRGDRIARAISAFVENPITTAVKGAVLVLIGVSEASRTLMEDIKHQQLRVGHGLILIGLFSILESVPHFIEGLEASKKYLDLREKKAHPEPGSSAGPSPNEERAR
jgi:hypothetical protein